MKKWTMRASLSRNRKGNRKWFLLRHRAEKCLKKKKKKAKHSPWMLPAISSCAGSWGSLPYWWLGTMNWRSRIQRGVGAVSVGAITDHPLHPLLPLSCKDSSARWNCTPIHTVGLKNPKPTRGQTLVKTLFPTNNSWMRAVDADGF